MEKEHLSKYFSTEIESDEQIAAYLEIRASARSTADVLNRLLPESASKSDILGRLFRIAVDSELAIRMDGVRRVLSPIVMTRQ